MEIEVTSFARARLVATEAVEVCGGERTILLAHTINRLARSYFWIGTLEINAQALIATAAAATDDF